VGRGLLLRGWRRKARERRGKRKRMKVKGGEGKGRREGLAPRPCPMITVSSNDVLWPSCGVRQPGASM